MDSYNINLKPSVERDLGKLSKSVVSRAMKRIEALAFDPFPRHAAKLSVAEGLYRVRVGDYRIIYGVNIEARQIDVHYVRHRSKVYRTL